VNVHEYQAKQLLGEYGIAVPEGRLATTAAEAESVAREIGGTVAVKAQVHAGGRGKGGGIKLAKSAAEAREAAEAILGMQLVTPQTDAEGKLVRKVYVEAGSQIDDELYLALLVDRETHDIAIIGSTEGGMAIEEVAAATPDKILTRHVDPLVGIGDFQARDLALDLGLNAAQSANFVKLLRALYRIFVEKDLSLLEINPLILSGDEVIPLDCKLNFDSSALYRHPDIAALRDPDEEDPLEAEASKHDLSWVSLEGNIGCMVNGAGLAMATMDIVKLAGGEPANFLDLGGGANKEGVSRAFKLILQDPQVKGILVNIFGGIVLCDMVAEGIVAAAKELSVSVPMVVRLDGTNADRAKEILAESGLDITPADGMQDGAEKIVAAVANA
jgi:succinyl-CoA synthetase beta subunit